MKKLGLSFYIAVIISFLLTSPVLAQGTDPLENNDTPGTASVVTLPYEATIRIDTNIDEDWFKVTLDREGALKFNMTISSGGIHLDYEIYTEGNTTTPVHSASDCYVGSSGYQRNVKLTSGVYYIRIKGHSGASSLSNLKLTLAQLPEDEMENNDTWERAFSYPLGEERNITINAVNDADWFRITLDREGALKFRVEPGSGSIYMDYAIFSGENKTVPVYSKEDFYVNNDGYQINYKLGPGTYYVQIKGNNGDFNDYAMKLILAQLPEDEIEKNDTWEQAYLFPLGEERVITVNALNDEDWFKVILDKEGALKFKINLSSGSIYFDYEIYKEGDIINPVYSRSNFYVDSNEQINVKLDPGVYYILLKGHAGKFNDNDMELVFAQLPEDEMENNDTLEQAYLYPLGEEKLFSINAVNDEDWFKIVLSREGALKFRIEVISGYIYLNCDIYNEGNLTKPVFSKGNLYVGSDYQSNMGLSPGVYYIRIKGNGNYFNDDYMKLTLDQLPEDELENNDTYDLAQEFPLGQERSISINHPNDADWFKVTIGSQTILKIRTENTVSQTVQLSYSVFTSDQITQAIPKAIYSTNFTLSSLYKNNLTNYPLQPGTYYIKLAGQNGSYMDEEFRITFYTDSYDVTRPEVTSSEPHDNALSADVYSNIEIIFSKPVDVSTLNYDNISLKLWNDPVGFSMEYDEAQNMLIIKPLERLNYGCKYNVILKNKIESRNNGFPMLLDYEFSFTTREKRPDDDLVGTLKGQVIIVDSLKGLANSAKIHIKNPDVYSNSAYADRYGNFHFEYVPAGTYEVTLELPGFICQSRTVTIEAYKEAVTELQPAFGDLNGDGIINMFDFVMMSKFFNMEGN